MLWPAKQQLRGGVLVFWGTRVAPPPCQNSDDLKWHYDVVFPQMLLRHLTEDKVPFPSGPEIAGTAFYPQPNNNDTRVTIFFFGLSAKIKLEIKTYRINLIQAITKLFFFLKMKRKASKYKPTWNTRVAVETPLSESSAKWNDSICYTLLLR